MRAPIKICAELRDRDLYDLCDEVARRHGVKLAHVCGSSREKEHVQARHAVWHKLYLWFGGNASAVARLFGTDPSTVRSALLDEPPLILHVVLAHFATHEHAYELSWFSGRVNPFCVIDKTQDVATWFPKYDVARAVFAECCELAGSPTFRSVAAGGALPSLTEGGASMPPLDNDVVKRYRAHNDAIERRQRNQSAPPGKKCKEPNCTRGAFPWDDRCPPCDKLHRKALRIATSRLRPRGSK